MTTTAAEVARRKAELARCDRCNDTGLRPLAAQALWLPMVATVAACRVPCECGARKVVTT